MESLNLFSNKTKCALLCKESMDNIITKWHFEEFDLIAEKREPCSCNFDKHRVFVLINPSSWDSEEITFCETKLRVDRKRRWIVLEDDNTFKMKPFFNDCCVGNTSVTTGELSRLINKSMREINAEQSFSRLLKGWIRNIVFSNNLFPVTEK